ncbi:MAG: hypothetical protein KIT22_02205 [Verrucomicrobiae bacterium]|nr:hypothetical protein [Verrucomicrobiae bacterium]
MSPEKASDTLTAMYRLLPLPSLRMVTPRWAGLIVGMPPRPCRSPPATAQITAAQATPVSALKIIPDFKVELLYTVPKEQEGSWVAMCTDPKGRLIVSDQYGPLYRLTPPPLGTSEGLKVEKINAPIGEAQGLLYAFDSLYVMVATDGFQGRGLYRVRDTSGDDQFDEVTLLPAEAGGGGRARSPSCNRPTAGVAPHRRQPDQDHAAGRIPGAL